MSEELNTQSDDSIDRKEKSKLRKQKLRNYFISESKRLGLVHPDYQNDTPDLSNLEAIPDSSGIVDTEESMDQLVSVFGGFYNAEDNSRARAPGTRVEFNERYLDMSWFEAQRVVSHELEHVSTFLAVEEVEGRENNYLFTIHPSYADLYQRMEEHYDSYKEEGYPFGKDLEVPAIDNLSNQSNYAHYNEVLSLLRGYEVYQRQRRELREEGVGSREIDRRLATQPYEFIEAFKLEDLRLLDPEYRIRLAQEVLDTNPEIMQQIEERRKVVDIGEIVLD